MTNQEQSPRLEITNDPQQVAEQQLALGMAWADIYANGTSRDNRPDQSAEITLRNPAVYLQDLDRQQLPEDLQKGWNVLLSFAGSVATIAATKPVDWSPGVSSLEKIQNLMHSGNIDQDYCGSVADVMRSASELFAKSTQIVPGNTPYFAGNVQGMESWIRNIQNK